MKIAIVAPLSQPFAIGGAEKLWWGLLEHFNHETPHQADLVKLPSPEADFWSLMGSYARFSALRLEGFDLVISTKYPAWMVEHPNHVVYLQHRLRGLYDAYPGEPAVPLEWARLPSVGRLRRFMRESAGQRETLDSFFALVFSLRGTDAERVLGFPGPLTREIVHYLDGIGLANRRIRRFAAIAETVARRKDYFPDPGAVAIVHHPSNLVVAPGNRSDYFFTASRLDGPKRIDLLINAMKHVSADIPFLIAGTGPAQAELERMAAFDPRVKLLGFRTDAELAVLYQNALAVPFAPWQEDYGLITFEAMAAGKPVVTTTDSGGPTELVVDGQNGFVVAPEASAIGAALDRLAADRALAKSLGQRGIETAARITWKGVSDALTSAPTLNCEEPPVIRFCGPEMRAMVRHRLGLAGRYALFVDQDQLTGSDAVSAIVDASRLVPEATFLVVGNVCSAFDKTRMPPNLLLLGAVDDAMLDVLLDFAHAALNPFGEGGTDQRVLGYFAAGIPVLSSIAGARGLGVSDGEHLFIVEPADMAAGFRRLLSTDIDRLEEMTENARRVAEQHRGTRLSRSSRPPNA